MDVYTSTGARSILRACTGIAAIAVACGGGGTAPAGPMSPSPPGEDAPPVFEVVELVYRLATGFVVLDARATDPDGDEPAIRCTGIVAATGTAAVRDSVAVARTEEDRTVSVACEATSTGLSVMQGAETIVPAGPPPPVAVVTHTFRVFDLTDHDVALVDGTLTVTIDGEERRIDAVDGRFDVEVPEDGGGNALAPAAVAVDVRYDDGTHATPLQILRGAPAGGDPYGERIAASWSATTLPIQLPTDAGAAFELFVAPDAFDRDRYFRMKADGDPALPHGALCDDVDPSGTADGILAIPYLFDETGFPITPTNRMRVSSVMDRALPDELSSGLRTPWRGMEVAVAPASPYLRVTAANVPAPGRHDSALDEDGCLVRMRYDTPIPTLTSTGDVSATDVRRRILQAIALPFGDPGSLVDGGGTYASFARAAVAAGVAIGPDPDFFTR